MIVALLIEVFQAHLRELEMSEEKARYQFQMLKNQINPHFLFNCLNVVSSLVYQDAEKTNKFAKKLSNVYRYLIHTYDYLTVSVAEELAFLNSYIYLEQMRFGSALVMHVSGEADASKRVFPVSVQMLVENAIKHNRLTESSPLVITVEVLPTGIRVSNNLQARSSTEGAGVGLANLRKQYEMHGMKMDIAVSEQAFTVFLPYLEA